MRCLWHILLPDRHPRHPIMQLKGLLHWLVFLKLGVITTSATVTSFPRSLHQPIFFQHKDIREDSQLKAESWLIEYLTSNKTKKLNDKIWNMKKIYKLTNKISVRNTIVKELEISSKEKYKHHNIGEGNAIIYTNTTEMGNNETNFEKIFDYLLENKCRGRNLESNTKKLKRELEMIFQNNRNRFQPTTWVIFSYLLKELGEEFNTEIHKEIEELSCLSEKENFFSFSYPMKEKDVQCLYYLTHLIMTRSDYYSHYVEDKSPKIQKIKSLLNKAVLFYSNQEIYKGTEVDILSETLIALRLTKEPINKNMESLYQKIIKLQNTDGSWGTQEEDAVTENSLLHHTFVAYAALSLKNDNLTLKDTKVYCKEF